MGYVKTTTNLDYKHTLKYLFFPSMASIYMIKKGAEITCNTTLKTKGIYLFIFGLYMLINTSAALYFTQTRQTDIPKIIKSDDDEERTFIMKVLRTALTAFLALSTCDLKPDWRKGVTPNG